MAIRCTCGHCKTEFLAPDKFAGRNIGCPVCQQRLIVPGGPPSAPQPPPKPLPSLLDETLGEPGAMSGGAPAGFDPSHLEDAWESDGTWRGIARRSRRETVRIPLHAAIAIFAVGALVFCLLVIVAIPNSAAVIGWIVFWTVGVGLILFGLGWEALIAMRQREGPGVFVLFPPLDLFYFLGHWDKTRKAFWTVLAGVAVCGGALGAIRLAQHFAAQGSQPSASPPPKTATWGEPRGPHGRFSMDSGLAAADARPTIDPAFHATHYRV